MSAVTPLKRKTGTTLAYFIHGFPFTLRGRARITNVWLFLRGNLTLGNNLPSVPRVSESHYDKSKNIYFLVKGVLKSLATEIGNEKTDTRVSR